MKTWNGTDDGMIKKTTEEDRTDENRHRSYGKGREQAGISQEGQRTMEKVREDTVYNIGKFKQ